MTDLRRAGSVSPHAIMQDVADLAGVSLGTVSNTLNRPDMVREKTRKRVYDAIDKLGFVRNDAARSLAAGTSSTIGIVIADMRNSFFVDIARGAEAAARENGMNLLVANSDIDVKKETDYLHVFEEARVAGILLAPLDVPEAGHAHGRSSTLPLVLVNFLSDDGSYSGVAADEREGGYIAARHLIGLGRRDLVFAGGPFHLRAVAERYEGVERAVADAPGVTLRRVETTGLNIRHGRKAAEEVMAMGGQRVDAIIAASDLIAIGCIQVFDHSPTHQVPSDVAVVGYDNNHFASENATPISTIGQPGEEMGRAAVELLLDEIRGVSSTAKRDIVLHPHLIARKSSIGDAWKHDA